MGGVSREAAKDVVNPGMLQMIQSLSVKKNGKESDNKPPKLPGMDDPEIAKAIEEERKKAVMRQGFLKMFKTSNAGDISTPMVNKASLY